MHQRLQLWRIASLAFLAPALLAAQPTAAAPGKADMTGLAEFWRLADAYRSGTPTSAAWDSLFRHPAYALIERQAQRRRVLERCVPLVFGPDRAAELEAVQRSGQGLVPQVCGHLTRARDVRRELDESTIGPVVSEVIDLAMRRAAVYLPETAPDEPPPIHVILFENNGFGGDIVVLDALRLKDNDRASNVEFLAHELHHALASASVPPRDSLLPDQLRVPMSQLVREGIASLIDKQSLVDGRFANRTGATDADRALAAQFSQVHGATPTRLAILDTVLSAHARRAEPVVNWRDVIPFGGHATGFYLAESIELAFGAGALRPLVGDPIGFILKYQEAARQLGGRFVFSDASINWLRGLLH